MWASSLQFKALHEYAQLPTYGSDGAIGLDLHAVVPEHITVLAPGERALIPTGLAAAIPQGFYGRVAPRSGLAVKYGIDVLAGVIDSDYRGEIKVALVNLGDKPFDIRTGDRVAQLVLERADRVRPVWAAGDLPSTDRGTDGFGSTGV